MMTCPERLDGYTGGETTSIAFGIFLELMDNQPLGSPIYFVDSFVSCFLDTKQGAVNPTSVLPWWCSSGVFLYIETRLLWVNGE